MERFSEYGSSPQAEHASQCRRRRFLKACLGLLILCLWGRFPESLGQPAKKPQIQSSAKAGGKEAKKPAAFPVKEDTSAVAGILPGFLCLTSVNMFSTPHLLLGCTRWNEETDEIADQFILHRNGGVWEAIRHKKKKMEKIEDALYTGDGVLFVAEKTGLYRLGKNGKFAGVKGKGIKHPVQIWGCSSKKIVVTSIDKIKEPYWWDWDFFMATSSHQLYEDGSARIHVISKKGDCLLPKGAYIPLYLECSGEAKDTYTLHLLTDETEGDSSACGMSIRKHSFKSMVQPYPFDAAKKNIELSFCKKTPCGSKTSAACIVFYRGVPDYEFYMLRFDGSGSSASPVQGIIEDFFDGFMTCEGDFYTQYPMQLKEGKWVEVAGGGNFDFSGRAIFEDEAGVIWTCGPKGIQRYHEGVWETVLEWKGLELLWSNQS